MIIRLSKLRKLELKSWRRFNMTQRKYYPKDHIMIIDADKKYTWEIK
jgi:hypothetical protein